ncbi:MAG: tRNA (adenosine(37)-N6)-dimethylallyltransferase MiaA [Bacteroidota bacterium]|nr:tRNA (adenosine(37)-N6)-dimethylallyltransferase MiaA [Bacteroidota bacterium]
MKNTLFILAGPTAVGKTDLSIELAKRLNTEIISADSRQVYKEMNIGTAIPSKEQLSEVKHHMIQNKSIPEYFSAGKYELEVLDILKNLFRKKKSVLLTGGSGMYIDAVCKGIDPLPPPDKTIRRKLTHKFETEGIESIRFDLKHIDPEYYESVDLNNPKRILKALETWYQTGKKYSSIVKGKAKNRPFNMEYIVLERDRQKLYDRINQRTDIMFDNGWIDEAKKLHKHKGINALNTVGYKEIFAYFDGIHSLERAKELIKRNTRHYAKRQITWFKRYENAFRIHPEETEKIFIFVENALSQANE